jgi:hypothetical protein
VHIQETGTGRREMPEHYEIRLDGVLHEGWSTWFEGLRVSADDTEPAEPAEPAERKPDAGKFSRHGSAHNCPDPFQ